MLKVGHYYTSLILERMEELFSDERNGYRGSQFFRDWILQPIKKLIHDIAANNVPLNSSTIKCLANQYYLVEKFRTKEEKLIWKIFNGYLPCVEF